MAGTIPINTGTARAISPAPLEFDDTNLNIQGGIVTTKPITIGKITLPTSGSSGDVLTVNSDGKTASFMPSSGGGSGSPGGTNGELQYNNSGSFGGVSPGTSGQVLTSQGGSLPPHFQTFSSGSGAIQQLFKGTINLNTTGDQVISLTGGATYIITDIVIYNASIAITSTDSGGWFSGVGRSGNQVAITTEVSPPTFNVLSTPQNFMSAWSGESLINLFSNGGNAAVTIGNTLYFSLLTPEGSTATCTMIIYGYILS